MVKNSKESCDSSFDCLNLISFSNDTVARKNFGPYTPGFIKIPYNDIEALEKCKTLLY